MLLVFEGLKNFRERLNLGERRYKKKANQLFTGRQGNEVDPRGMNPKGYVQVWGIPRSFCVDCGLTKYGFANSLRVITESQPQIGLEILDVITYWICHDCHMDEQLGGSLVVTDDDGDEVSSRDTRREKNIMDWVKAAYMRGDKPAMFNGDMKRVDNHNG